MPGPRMPNQITIRTPGSPVVDPETGNSRPGLPTTATTRAYLSQRPVADVGSQIELLASQQTTITLWTVIVPRGTVLTSASTFTDEQGRGFAVTGEPADRPNRRPQFRAAAARLISDMQA